ncbi:tRNA (N6-threonylcarbamoyladenosine(37)-N6)-methyltransferase TrmO [Bdellovibrio bacteriovorus]|uniref:tRNA (N6-threonylcarbamoyladenosine(37)-N6)-methyltransferase TrmO n=1 Tax=Bdellovibrio bacteriovorus TaxID=959 RepID=UPI0021D1B429|nr:tRNA (N6-threonylcarbamoyladenosine(37)-N6)-methyltransferase TrmO [Bdellovibrio bacteriovorus]UXR63761.1 tRNA (N6-threonylcarbamoyladenosine(37)-N6)-methyltransferase TrmO [Bdellovibrio bacteriovorus]
MASKIEFTAIGTFHSPQVHPYEAGRQPDEFHSAGYIELNCGHNFEQALTGLEGCERIWVVFLFHHNDHWNPMVLPPRGSQKKLGVFATRSPYRPNPVGISCVKIKHIDKLKIFVEGADLLDGSPILDIKPYVAYADSFPGIEPDWLKNAEKFVIDFSLEAQQEIQWLELQGLQQLRSFLLHQLEFEPDNSRKKRVKPEGQGFVIAYRTWRAYFEIQEQHISVMKIFSGYSEHDLAVSEDTYQDKNLHREFKKLFP